MTTAPRNSFLLRTRENADFNQYWYSAKTIATMVEAVEAHSKKAAFLSTPSIFFSLRDEPLKQASRVLDYDKQWSKHSSYIYYDYKKPEDIPTELHHQFDMVVIDPPFITRDVWELYTKAARTLLAENGKVLLSTVAENAEMMKELLDVNPVQFKPSIPHLVYQYLLYTNFDSDVLGVKNDEIPDEDE